jgi:hypothetical protein
MTVITKTNLKPEWHTQPLIIQTLAKGKLNRKDLKSKLQELQKNHPDPLLKGNSHSDSSYNYWIRKLKKQGIIQEDENKELSLTDLGKWLAQSKSSDLFNRMCFLDIFICEACSNGSVVLMKPLLDQKEQDAKGSWLLLQCPNCKGTTAPVRQWTEKELISLYRTIKNEMKQFVKLLAEDI